MGFYERHVFPRIVDMTLGGAAVSRLRRELLVAARPDVLELGFGTGLNLPWYPRSIEEITAVELDDRRPGFVERRLAECRVRVRHESMDATALRFSDASFDTVVTSFFLCSVADPTAVLREIARVLAPEGRYLFLEHGRSPRPVVRAWQRVMVPVTRRLGCGCQPDLPIADLVRRAGFAFDDLKELELPQLGRASGHLFSGQARKSC